MVPTAQLQGKEVGDELSRSAKERRRTALSCGAGQSEGRGIALLPLGPQADSLARPQERQGHGENLVSAQGSADDRLLSLWAMASGLEIIILSPSPTLSQAISGCSWPTEKSCRMLVACLRAKNW